VEKAKYLIAAFLLIGLFSCVPSQVTNKAEERVDSLYIVDRDSVIALASDAVEQDLLIDRWFTLPYALLALLVFSLFIVFFAWHSIRRKNRMLRLQEDLLTTRSRIVHYQDEIFEYQSKLEETTDMVSREREENKSELRRLMFYHRELSIRLFQTRPEYKFILDYDSAQREGKILNELSQTDADRIREIIEGIFVSLIRRLRNSHPELSSSDRYCCVLSFMGFPNSLIAYLMKVEPNVSTQRRYRIRSKMDNDTYNWVFKQKSADNLLFLQD
jgi:hypothetical protein